DRGRVRAAVERERAAADRHRRRRLGDGQCAGGAALVVGVADRGHHRVAAGVRRRRGRAVVGEVDGQPGWRGGGGGRVGGAVVGGGQAARGQGHRGGRLVDDQRAGAGGAGEVRVAAGEGGADGVAAGGGRDSAGAVVGHGEGARDRAPGADGHDRGR